jgi:hypothetical protein
MVTYAYWLLVVLLMFGALWLLGVQQKLWMPALAVAGVIVVVGWGAYYFHFQQIFVKRWGGVMHIDNKAGRYHLGSTWKDDNLWVETYDPKSNTCYFNEYSKGNLLQGKVIIRDCNPLVGQPQPTAE